MNTRADQLNGRFSIFGNGFPLWLLVAAVVMASAGGGIGTVLAGNLIGALPVTISQALLIGSVSFPNSDSNWGNSSGTVQGVGRDTFISRHAKPDRSIGVVSNDKTAFQAAAEIDTGDVYLVQVCFKNASNEDLVAQLDLDIPDGIEAEVLEGAMVKGKMLAAK